jgi:PKD repeat protein
MRRLLLLISNILIFNIIAFAQTTVPPSKIVGAEYFFDQDPGVGKGTNLAFTAGDSIIFNTSIPVPKLAAGMHILALRFRDYKGHWGLQESRTFLINNTTNTISQISGAEYFFNSDPGMGKGTPLSITNGDSTLLNTALLTNGLPSGFHKLTIRFKDTNGHWGFNESRSFLVNNVRNVVAQISSAEYFIDKDPGIGMGTAINTGVADSVLLTNSIASTNLKTGFHVFVTRFRDTKNNWSFNEARTFYVNATTKKVALVTAAEYFFDADPGIGRGKAIPVSTAADSIALNSMVSSAGLSNGVHVLAMRFKDTNGNWSLNEARQVKICSLVPKASFSFNINNPVTFTNNSANSLSYLWQFKDGATDTATNPIHKFPTPGNYNVCLIGKNACSSDTLCKNVFIRSCAPGYVGDGFYDNFTSDGNPVNTDYSGVYPFGEPSLGAPAHPNFQAALSRNYATKSLDVKLNQGNGEYVPFGFNFGDSNGNGTGTPYYLSLTDKSFSVMLTNKSASQVIKFRVALVDANNKVLDTYAAAMKDSGGFANAYKYPIEKTVNPGNTLLFTDDFSKGIVLDMTNKTFRTDFDFTKVKAVYFIVSNAYSSLIGTTYQHNGLVDLPLSISNVKVGAVSSVRVLPQSSVTICKGGVVSLSAAGAKSYSWSPASGLTSSVLPNIEATPLVTTTYVVKGNSYGCISSDSVNVIVRQPPSAAFSFSNNTIPNTIDFKLISQTLKSGYYWDFGDNQSASVSNPSHQYNIPGSYLVSLNVLDSTASGCQSNTNTATILVGNGGCNTKAGFTFSKDTTTSYYTFVNTSTNATTWDWDFGTGATSFSKNVSFALPPTGNFNVCLTVRDTVKGCQSIICKTINAGPSSILPCQTKYNYFTDGISTKVQFDGYSLNNHSSKYYWSFGNGDISTLPNPVYTFASPGYKEVCLSTIDSATKCQSRYCSFIQTGSGGDCQAKFLASGEAGSTAVNFQDQSIGESTSWYWDFGDGIANNAQNPKHLFAAGGYYKVCLTTVNKSGCQNTYCTYVHAGSGDCKTDFTYFVDPIKKSIEFKDLSTGSPVKWFWSFGDGNNSAVQNPSYTYVKEGIYTVCLNSNNAGGCLSHLCQDVTVGQSPQSCMAKFDGFVVGKTATFKNRSVIGNANTYFWDFGDQSQSTSTQENPSHVYLNDGYYTVTFTLYNKINGCFNTTYKTVVVGNASTINCQAKFSYFANDSTNLVTFKDESVGNPVKWSWRFSDGGFSTDQYPVHKFAGHGFYEVCLTIKSANGTSNVYCTVVGIGQKGLDAKFTYESDTSYYFKNTALYPVSFYGAAYGKPSKWKWNFGDTYTDSLRINVIHNYQQPNAYNACLTITDDVAHLSSQYCRIVKVSAIAGIKESTLPSVELNVYPNPMSGKGTVSYVLTEPTQIQLSLFDLHGKKIKVLVNEVQQGIIHQAIDLSDLELSQGMYLIHLNVNGKFYNKPIILNK